MIWKTKDLLNLLELLSFHKSLGQESVKTKPETARESEKTVVVQSEREQQEKMIL